MSLVISFIYHSYEFRLSVGSHLEESNIIVSEYDIIVLIDEGKRNTIGITKLKTCGFYGGRNHG